jgi:hypothetical protein
MTATKSRAAEPAGHYPIDDRLVGVEARLSELEAVVCELALAIVGVAGTNVWGRSPRTRKIWEWQQELERRDLEVAA